MISFSSHHSQLLPVCPHANCLLASAALLPSVCLVPSVFIAESNVPYRVLLCYRGSLLVVSLSNTGSQTPRCPLQPQPYPCLTHGSCFFSLHAESHSQPYGTAVSRSCLCQPSPFDEGLAEMQGNAALHLLPLHCSFIPLVGYSSPAVQYPRFLFCNQSHLNFPLGDKGC